MKDLITKKVSTFCGLKIRYTLANKDINDLSSSSESMDLSAHSCCLKNLRPDKLLRGIKFQGNILFYQLP